jgi:predicted aspartyl protease
LSRITDKFSTSSVTEFLPQHKILVTEEIVNRDTSTPSPKFVVGRQVIKSDGVYVEGAIQGMKMTFTADTGAARTVVSAKIFHKIPLLSTNTSIIISVLGGITKWSADLTLLKVSGCPIWMHGILVLFSSIIPSVSFISAGPPSPFIRISKPNKASSSISAIITSLSRVNLPNLMVKFLFY